MVPPAGIEPVGPLYRRPEAGNLRGEAKAPEALAADQLALSVSHSVLVGNLHPDGQTLLVLPMPCHRLSLAGERQSALGDKMKLLLPGLSVLLRVVVVAVPVAAVLLVHVTD